MTNITNQGVEEVLFDDQPIPLDHGVDVERAVNKIVDLQERMATGSKLISRISARIESAKAGDYLPKAQFTTLVRKLKECKKLWTSLKNECMDIAALHPAIWPEYFKLANEELTPYFTYGGEDVVDEHEQADSRMAPSEEIYRDTHLFEMNEYDREVNENPFLPRDSWNFGYEKRLQNKQLEFDALAHQLEESGF